MLMRLTFLMLQNKPNRTAGRINKRDQHGVNVMRTAQRDGRRARRSNVSMESVPVLHRETDGEPDAKMSVWNPSLLYTERRTENQTLKCQHGIRPCVTQRDGRSTRHSNVSMESVPALHRETDGEPDAQMSAWNPSLFYTADTANRFYFTIITRCS